MSIIETIIAVQNYFLVKFGIGQIIFIRKQKINIDEKFGDNEYTRHAAINGC